ncbi:MAG TPA: hypothetical protein PLH29_01770 [bacterium]|nr:hypothetical protein [bacterium]
MKNFKTINQKMSAKLWPVMIIFVSLLTLGSWRKSYLRGYYRADGA